MLSNYHDYEEAYEAAIDAITSLREAAENLKEELEDVIESCETLEGAI